MEIRVIFDKEAQDERLKTGWGVAFLVDNKILFDTGEKGEYLLSNMALLGIDPKTIEGVVISHDHWDHTGGLQDLLKAAGPLKIYACPHFSREFKDKVKSAGAELVENSHFSRIAENIFVTGEISGEYKGVSIAEQALVAKTQNGLTIVTGCSHPGIVKIVEAVKKEFPQEKIFFVFGGFHLMDKQRREIQLIIDEFKKLGVIKAGPTHCSGYQAQEMFKQAYGDNAVEIKVGGKLEV